jgi:alpha-glucosidase
MPWGPGTAAGFTTGDPWLPAHPDAERLSVAAQAGEPRSALELYRALLALRRATPALRLGAYRSVDAAPDVFAYVREHEGERVLVAINFAPFPRALPATGRLLLSTHADPPADELAGDEARVVAMD